MTHNLIPHPGRLRWATATLCLLAACGAGGTTGNTSGGGGGGATGGDPGSGGGPGEPGGAGNPLDIVLDFKVSNGSTSPRTETIFASVPFPEGAYPASQLGNLVVSGYQTAWLPLQYWADGSLKVAQAQFTEALAAGETKTYRIARDEPPLSGAFTRNPWVAQLASGLEFGAEVRDTFQVPYRSFATGAGQVLQSTPLAQTTRWRTYHQPVAGQTGIGRDYLTSTFYVTEYRDMPFVVVDWILGNDYLGADTVPTGNTDPNLRVLGNADVRGAWFLCKGASAVMPYRAATEAIGNAETMNGGYTGHRVLTDDWLADAQTRRYRFLLRMEPAGAGSQDLARWQQTAGAMLAKPLYALASQSAWEQTKAAGLLGGPIAGPSNAASRAAGELGSWESYPWFGTWGSRGDAMATGTTGTPRNHPLSPELAHAIQGAHPALLLKLEQMAWAQAMRTYHMWNLQVGAEQNIILWSGTPLLSVSGESLGRRRIRDNDPYPQYRVLSTGQPPGHNWEPYDEEHFTCDLLFDYWTISGDAWAKEELRQLGQSLRGLMRLRVYYTASLQPTRAEGWTMQGFAQCYQATRDESLKTYVMRRITEIVDPQRAKTHASRAMKMQETDSHTGYPGAHQFFMPWQHGAVLYGYLGAYKVFNEPVLRTIAEDIAYTVEYSWVTNYTSPIFGFVSQGLRYYVPSSANGVPVGASHFDSLPGGIKFGDSPLGGAHTFLIGGLFHLANMTSDTAVRTKALLYGGFLRGTVNDAARWDKWYFCLPSNRVQ